MEFSSKCLFCGDYYDKAKPRICLSCWETVKAVAAEYSNELLPVPIAKKANLSAHPEDTCEDCGRDNVTWFAPSKLWNDVARREDGSDPMLCPICFIKRAEAAGQKIQAWQLAPEFYDSPNDQAEAPGKKP